MMKLDFYIKKFPFIFPLILFNQGSTYTVQLNVPDVVHGNQVIQVNCSSDDVPYGKGAEFLLNGETLTNLRSPGNICFNTAVSRECTPEICKCSDDDKSFAIFYNTSELENDVKKNVFSCQMKFNGNRIVWSNGITVTVLAPPTLSITELSYCNISQSVVLKCRIRGGTAIFGFGSWTHSFNGIDIRSMEGIIEDRLSILVVPSCGSYDTGQYMCHVWNSFGDGVQWSSKSTILRVREPPKFRQEQSKEMMSYTVFTTIIYSTSEILSVSWYKNGVLLENSTAFHQSTTPEYLTADAYGKHVTVTALRSKLTTRIHKFQNRNYSVCATNEYLTGCEIIDYERVVETITRLQMIYMVAGFACFVSFPATATLITLLMKHKVCKSSVYTLTVHNQPSVYNRTLTNPEINVIPADDISLDPTYLEVTDSYLDVQDGSEKTSEQSDCYEQME